MHLLRLDLCASDLRVAEPPVSDQASPVAESPEAPHLHDLWPPAAVADRMAARELELERLLGEVRASIIELRLDRELLIGQLRDLTRPTDWPELLDAPARPAQTAEPSGGPTEPVPAAEAQPCSEPPPELAALPEPAAPLTEPSVHLQEHSAVEHAAEPVPIESAAGPPRPRTPEEEFEALVRRLRTPVPDDEVERAESVRPHVEAKGRMRPVRLVTMAASVALLVLGTPTVGQVRGDAGFDHLPSRVRFIDVFTPSGLRPEGAAWTAPAPTLPGLRLEVTTLRPAWIQAVIDDGWTVEQVLDGGVTIPLDGEEAISLILSDAGAVRLRINGEDHGLAGSDGEAVARQFETSTVVTTGTDPAGIPSE